MDVLIQSNMTSLCSLKHLADPPHTQKKEKKSPDLVVELLVAGVKGLQLLANEFVQNAPVYQRLTQLPDLRPVVPGVTQRALQRL